MPKLKSGGKILENYRDVGMIIDFYNKTFTGFFYQPIFNYLLRMNPEDFYPSSIPTQRRKKELQVFSKSICEMLIQEHLQEFVNGFGRQEAYQKFKEWCINNDHNAEEKWEFLHEKIMYCDTDLRIEKRFIHPT